MADKIQYIISFCLYRLGSLSFIVLFSMRLLLVPVCWLSGASKFDDIASTIEWFGNANDGLGLPYPAFMAYASGIIGCVGAVFLAIGFMVRYISIPLIIVMLLAMIKIHWPYGWDAIAPYSAESMQRLGQFMEWLQENHPERWQYITELGEPVMLNNGIEFTATYIVLLSALLVFGAGNYLSADYWINKWLLQTRKTNYPML